MKFLYTIICASAWILMGVQAQLGEFYCGDENCYDVLGVEATAKPKEIMKAYRSLAKKYHPDVRRQEKDEDKRREMEDMYLLLNKAYETLNTVSNRKEYDAIIADGFRYRVLKRKYYGGGENVYIHPLAPIILVLVAGSLLQRFNRNKMMESEKRRCMNEVAKNEEWLAATAKVIAANNCVAEMAALKEANPAEWIKKALALNPVEFVFQVKPVQTHEIFAIQAIKFPYTAVVFIMSFMSEYSKSEKKLTRADKITKTANAFGISEAQLIRRTDRTLMSDGEHLGDLDALLKKKLWKPKNMAALQEERMQARLKKIPKHRRALFRKEMEQAQEEARNNAYKEQFAKSFAKGMD